MPNKDIRIHAFKNNIKMYQIAERLGIHYVTLNAMLRNDLTKEKKEQIINIIDELRKENINGK